MKQQELIPHLFRTEYSKITAVLCRRFGFEHIEVAEDIASETFLAAMEAGLTKVCLKTQWPGFTLSRKIKQLLL